MLLHKKYYTILNIIIVDILSALVEPTNEIVWALI